MYFVKCSSKLIRFSYLLCENSFFVFNLATGSILFTTAEGVSSRQSLDYSPPIRPACCRPPSPRRRLAVHVIHVCLDYISSYNSLLSSQNFRIDKAFLRAGTLLSNRTLANKDFSSFPTTLSGFLSRSKALSDGSYNNKAVNQKVVC